MEKLVGKFCHFKPTLMPLPQVQLFRVKEPAMKTIEGRCRVRTKLRSFLGNKLIQRIKVSQLNMTVSQLHLHLSQLFSTFRRATLSIQTYLFQTARKLILLRIWMPWGKMAQIFKTHFLISMKCYLAGLVANHFANANLNPKRIFLFQ